MPWQSGWNAGRPGISIGTPGYGGDYGYPVTDPNPGSCINGFTRNHLGQCVPIQTVPECPTGFARDAQGNCIQIPVTPVPITPGMSAQLVRIELPTSFIQGKVVTIRTWYQNYRSDSPLYSIKISLPGISFTHETPPVPSTAVGQTLRVDSTFTVPNFAQIAIYPPPPITGTVSLLRYQTVQCVTTPCNPQLVETPDTANISLYRTVAPTPKCPTGYTGVYPRCVKIPRPPKPRPRPTPTPTVGNCSKADQIILQKWKELATKFEADRQRKCPGSGLGGQIQCKVATDIAAAWKKNYQNKAKQCGVAASMMAYSYATAASASIPATISVTPTTVTRMGTFVVEGAGYSPAETVMIEVRVAGQLSRTAQIANSSGQIRKNIRAPNNSGVALITATSSSGRRGSANITVS